MSESGIGGKNRKWWDSRGSWGTRWSDLHSVTPGTPTMRCCSLGRVQGVAILGGSGRRRNRRVQPPGFNLNDSTLVYRLPSQPAVIEGMVGSKSPKPPMRPNNPPYDISRGTILDWGRCDVVRNRITSAVELLGRAWWYLKEAHDERLFVLRIPNFRRQPDPQESVSCWTPYVVWVFCVYLGTYGNRNNAAASLNPIDAQVHVHQSAFEKPIPNPSPKKPIRNRRLGQKKTDLIFAGPWLLSTAESCLSKNSKR